LTIAVSFAIVIKKGGDMKKLFKEYSTHIGVAFLFLLVFSPMILSVAFSSHDQVYYGE